MPKNRTLSAALLAALVPLAARAQTPAPPPASPAGSVQAATAAAAAPEPPTEAEVELDAAIKKLAALKSVSADLAETVDMLDQSFEIKGRYLRAPNRRTYLRLSVTGLADAAGTMLQVCDGETLWDYKQILESQSYGKIEVGKVFEKLQSPEIDPAFRDQVLNQFGFAGPDELLRGLRRAVRFDSKAADTLDEKVDAGLKGKKVWVLRGEWKSREGLTGPNQQPLPLTASLPAYVPSRVTLTVGQDDGWPYVVRLAGNKPSVLTDTRKIGPDGRPIGARSSIQEVKPTVIVISYVHVVLNPDLKVDEFVFQAPPSARVDDATQSILTMLDQAIQGRAAQKKAEAAKGEPEKAAPGDGALLDQAIDVPRTRPNGTAPPAATTAPPASAPR